MHLFIAKLDVYETSSQLAEHSGKAHSEAGS
jgi:hypothetical protein